MSLNPVPNLGNVVGQEKLIARLRMLLEQGVPGHAYAFSGAAGMGKRTLAHAFAAQWLCTEKRQAPCGKCRSCSTFAAGTHPDVVIIRPEERKISIEAIRSMQEIFSVTTSYGKRLCLMEDAERMNESAQNCLLKTLEEPPADTLLLLTTSGFDSLMPTIRSRVVRLPLDGYGKDELDAILRKAGGSRSTDFLAAFSRGIPGRAMQLLNSKTLESNRQLVVSILPQGPAVMGVPGMEALWRHLSESKTDFPEVADLLQGLLRDLLAAHEGVDGRLINADKTDTIRKVARIRTREDWIGAIHKVDDIRQAVQFNLNHQMAVDAMSAALGPLFDL